MLLAELCVSNRQKELKVTGSKERVMTERILQDHVALRSALRTAELPKTGGRAVSQLTLTLLL